MKLCLSLLLLASSAVAQTTAVERFLVPIYLVGPTPGAYGSLWSADLRILNTGPTTSFIENFGFMSPVLFSPEPLPPDAEITGGSSIVHDSAVNPGIPAAMLFVRSEFVDDLTFSLRVRDISRSAETWGAWVPVVHESEATRELHLLDVPVDARYRDMLRVYAFHPVPGRRVTVRVYGTRDETRFPAPADPLLAEVSMPLEVGGSSTQPAYAHLSDIATLPGVTGYRRLRLLVQPVGDFPIWGMVSVTNNTTQEVTMIMPNSGGQ